MVRGYQKRVIFLKNTGSPVFDEAYFIIGNNKDPDLYSKDDLIQECERIIDENLGGKIDRPPFLKRLFAAIKKNILSFCIGVFIGAAITLLIALLF